MIWVKLATILVAAFSMLLAAWRYREWRGGMLLLACVFLAAAMNELEAFWPWYRRWKLRRKDERYLAHIRVRYGIRDCGKRCGR